MNLKLKILEIHPSRYSDGTLSKCWIFNLCDLLDPSSDSFKEVKEKKDMENSNLNVTGSTTPLNYELSFSDPELQKQYDENLKKMRIRD